MSTATKTRQKVNALAELEALEAAWVEARDRERQLGGELKQKINRQRELLTRRQRLIHREPGLVNHASQPLSDTNEVAGVDKSIEELGDLNDLTAQVNHARELERVARQRFEAYASEQGAAIDQARQLEGEALLADYQASAEAHAALAEQLVAFGQRSLEFAHIRRLDPHAIPIDGAADAARTARAMASSPPALPLQDVDR